MASEEELYISIDLDTYRIGKSNLLRCQADTLSSLKRLYNLRILARQKSDLKKILQRLLNSVEFDVNAIQDRMPTSSVPETLHVVEVEKVKPKETFSRNGDIEAELTTIQEKLRELNS